MNNGYNPTARSTDPQTSRDAAQAQQGAKVYDQVLATIQQAGAKGCTLDDLAAALPNHEKISISPAPARLKEQGIIYETGTTRTGKSGRQQIVHTAYMPGEQVSIPAVTQRARRSANTATPAPQVEMVSDEMVGDAMDAFNAEAITGEEFLLSKRAGIRMKAALQAALNARAGGDGWLPIESAPKSVADGRRVDGIYLLGFIPDADACDPLSCMDTIWWEPLLPNTAGGRGKWCAGKSDIEVSPTHWQPLPTPPAALASQAVGVKDGR